MIVYQKCFENINRIENYDDLYKPMMLYNDNSNTNKKNLSRKKKQKNMAQKG